jgi:hypothetical protein
MKNAIDGLFASKLAVLNVGPRVFGDAIRTQGVKVVQVDWKPVAQGDKEMTDLLDLLGGI